VRLLLDTHVLLWWLAEPLKLSKSATRAIRNGENVAYVSAASVWEIAIKNASGKLDGAVLLDNLEGIFREQGFQELPITAYWATRAASFPGSHRDPFDRMLAAQAHFSDPPLVIISRDRAFEKFGVRRLW
jgi:PIN domain nuclease of toxin-antitoxin system